MLIPPASEAAVAVCKIPETKEIAREVCMAVGLCANREMQYTEDLMRLQRARDETMQEAGQRGQIVFPKP